MTAYRGRIAPTPTGYLHLGHARTFWVAQERACGGALVLRNEDLDADRCKKEYVDAFIEDLTWIGLSWSEGPDRGGPHDPYDQSGRLTLYEEVWKRLGDTGQIYPSPHSRQDVRNALQAPHQGEEGPLFPPSLRPPLGTGRGATSPGSVNWRFRVPDGSRVRFHDANLGWREYEAGLHFGDFIVWRKDGCPSYELAVMADDHEMAITEVVRGEDLLLSTARQLLIYESLGWNAPAFYHCLLMRDSEGRRLAKRAGSLSVRSLRHDGLCPDEIRAHWWESPEAWENWRRRRKDSPS